MMRLTAFLFLPSHYFFFALSGHQKAEYLTGEVFHHERRPLLS